MNAAEFRRVAHEVLAAQDGRADECIECGGHYGGRPHRPGCRVALLVAAGPEATPVSFASLAREPSPLPFPPRTG